MGKHREDTKVYLHETDEWPLSVASHAFTRGKATTNVCAVKMAVVIRSRNADKGPASHEQCTIYQKHKREIRVPFFMKTGKFMRSNIWKANRRRHRPSNATSNHLPKLARCLHLTRDRARHPAKG